MRRFLVIALVALGATAAPASAAVTVDSPSKPEGENLVFTVANGDLTPALVRISGATAAAGDDYASRTDDVVGPGETKTFAVQTTADDRHEANETIVVSAGGASGTGTILDDDAPAFTVKDVTVAENAKSARVELTTPDVLRAVDVAYAAAAGSATTADFPPATGTLRLAPGDTTKTVDVPIADDTADEEDEAFTVSFTSGARSAAATVTITNDDLRLISVGDVGVVERDGATTAAAVPIVLSGPTFRTVTVRWSTYDGTAKAPRDFLSRLATVTIPPGQTSVNVTVPIVSDDVEEGPEAFGVGIANAQGARLFKTAGVVTITDDDALVPGRSAGSGADGVAPKLRLSRPGGSAGRALKVLVGCPKSEQRCTGRVTLFAKPDRARRAKLLRTEHRIGAKRFSLPGNATQTIRMTVPAALYRAAQANRRLKVSAYLVARDAAGNVDTRVTAATLRVKPAKQARR